MTHKATSQATLAQRVRARVAIAIIATLFAPLAPEKAYAVSSWNPTLLVNTESFQMIDVGDGSTTVDLRFGATTSTLKLLSTSTFQFSRSLSVLGGISGSYLTIDRQANISGSLVVKQNIVTKGALETKFGITFMSGALMNELSGLSSAINLPTANLATQGVTRLMSNGNLQNIGSIQAGETLLSAGGTFAAKADYTTGSNPYAVAVGDLNGDGKADLAVSHYTSTYVSVFLNNGNGTFAAKADYTTGSAPYSVAIGDLNGDGKADLATPNYGATSVSVLLNKGDGTFATKVDYATGTSPDSVAIGDLNGDGKADLAVTNLGSTSVSVFLNNGNGTFAAKVDYTTGTQPYSVAIGDLSGDGKADLAVANYGATSVSILLNNGNGTFASKVDYTTGSTPYSVAIGDLNADDKEDLAVANFGATSVSILLNNGNGTFASKVDYATTTAPISVAIGDLNGDGKADLAASNYTSSAVSVFLNNGNGTFAARVNYTTGLNPTGVAIGDLSGDGKADLAVANYGATSVSVLLNERNTILFAASGTGGRVGIGTSTPKAKLDVLGTLSGSKLRITESADIHGPLAVSGAIRGDGDLTINDDRTTSADAVLTFGNSTTNQTLKYVHSLQKFEFSKDLRVVGSISGTYLTIDRQANISGSLVVKQNAAIRGNLSGTSFFGAGLGDCNNATSSKLIYNPSTGKFSCATDQTGGSSGGLSYGVARDIFVNQSGDTMTGALTMNMKTAHTETGALNIVQQTHATGAYIKSTTGKESALAIDIVGTPNAPHLLFGYQGVFDTNLYRSSANLLKTNSSFFATGTLSGSKLRVSGSADIHGPLAVSGAIRGDGDLTINDDRTTSVDAVLTFGNSTTNQTLKYVHSLQKFEFSKDLRVVGSISGSAIRIDGTADIHGALNASGAVHFDSNVSINDDRSSGDAILTFGNATLNQDLKYIDANQRFQFSTNVNVMGSISGASLIVSGASAFSGAALFRTRVTAKAGFSGATLYGAGLGDCSNATSSKLLYNPSTGKFSCGTDQTGGGSSGGGLGYAAAEGIFVNQGGDTMTGTLNIKVTSADVVKTTTGTSNATDFSKAGSTLLNVSSANDVLTMDRGTVPSNGQGTFGASSVVTTANLGAGAHTILRDDGDYVIFLGNGSTTVNIWDGIGTSMSAATAATTAIGAGAISLRRPDGRYLVVPGGASTAGFVYDPFNVTANSAVTLTSCTATTGTNAFLVSTGSYVLMCGGSGNWGLYNGTSNLYQPGVALGASFGAGAHAIQRDDGTFLVFAGGNTSNHWIFYPGQKAGKAWSVINPISGAPTITTGAFSIRRSDGKYLIVGGAQDASTIYDPAPTTTNPHGTFTAQSGVGYGPTVALADGAQALWRQDRKYTLFIGGSQTTNIIDVSRSDQYQFVAGPAIGAAAGAGFHAVYNGRGTVQLFLGGASTTTRYFDVGYIKGGPSTSTGAYYETECITTSLHSGSYLTWKTNGDDHKTKFYVQTGKGSCNSGYKIIPKSGDLIRPTSGDNRIQMKVVFERLPAKFADQEWGLRRGLSQTQYRRLIDVPGLQELVVRNTANLHRTQFEFGRGGPMEPLGVNIVNNGDKNLSIQLANSAAYPTTINATNTNLYNGAFASAPAMPRTISIGTVVLKRPDGKFVIIPGSNSGSTAQQRSMIYDQDANVFYNNSASPTVPLSSGALAFKRHNGTFLIVAGGNLNATNVYDPVTNTFTEGPKIHGLVREGSQVMAMPNGRVTIIHGGFQQTTTIYDSYSNATTTGAALITTVGRGSFVIPKPDGSYLVGPGASASVCTVRTTSMLFNPYANYFVNNPAPLITTGTGPGAYAVERSDGTWLLMKGGGTANSCAGTTATQIYNPFANKILVGPTLSAAVRFGSTAMQRPDGSWLITAGGGLTTTSIVNEKSGAMTAEGIGNVGTSNTGPALVTAAGTGSLAFQRDDGKYVLLSGANAAGSPGTAVAQIYDPAWVLDGYYRSEPINVPDLDSTSTLSWQTPDARGITARVRTGTSAITLQTSDERELEASGDRISPGTGHTWVQVNFSFRRYLPPNKGIYEDVWYNGGAMPHVNFRQITNPMIQQFSIGKDKDIANFQVDETPLFRVSGNGDIYTGTKGALFSGGADLAERYHSYDALKPGDLVTFDYDDDHAVRRSTVTYQPELIGVVSTSPGFVAGAYTKDSFPIALVGRVPVNVSLENGPIKTGDRLTSASIPGYAMKAARAGRVVGVALESSKPEKFSPCVADPKKMCGQVMMFVNLSDWMGPQ